MRDDRHHKQRIAADLEDVADAAGDLAERLGLAPYPVNYWVVDHDEMNELIAYDGFQTRYPHWRWGMKYDRQRKQDTFFGGKAFEIVNNDSPASAFLQESNSLADQKAVITHVEAHADFFANNEWFGLFGDRGPGAGVEATDRPDDGPNAAALLERHAETVREILRDPDVERDDVERFVDAVLCIEDTIDQHVPFDPDPGLDDDVEGEAVDPDDLDVSDPVREQVFGEEFGDGGEEDRHPPVSDVLAYLREHGKQYDEEEGRAVEFEDWQREILDALRTEAYYFAPQRMTKTMNEGWACVAPGTPVFTAHGLVPMEDVVADHTTVSDGETTRAVYDSHVIEDHDTVTVETRRGFELTGSNNHRVRRPDGSWVRLDELEEGDEIAVTGGNGVWPEEYVALDWENPEAVTLDDVAADAGVSLSTVLRYRDLGRARDPEAIASALEAYDGHAGSEATRETIRVPEQVTEKVGRFLGLLIGDGHVPANSRHVGFTSGEQAHAEEFAGLVEELFGVSPTVSEQESRWRVYAYSKNLRDLLTEAFDLPTGEAADRKTVPSQVRRSPRSVVAEFLRGLFDADGYAGEQGAILSTSSEELSEQVQLLLTNFGVLTRRRQQSDGCYHVHVTGESANRFHEEVGFGYDEKAAALTTYLDELAWFEGEKWTDEVVALSEGTGTVYDISVEETHRYAAAGLCNHNSKWEKTMMSGEAFAGADEFVEYADHMAKVLNAPGMNPYKLGLELWEYVENTTNRREVVERLLRVEGVTWRNFHDALDFERVQELLAPHPDLASVPADDPERLLELPGEKVDCDAVEAAMAGDVDLAAEPWRALTYEGLAERHYSLAKPANRGFVRRVGQAELEATSRYLFDDERYPDVETALADVDHAAGWDRMFEVRESHNDVTFIDEFLTQEFVDEHDYFAYEHSRASEDYRSTGSDAEDVKKKLLLQFTNFGNPTVEVLDGNYRNRNELLLGHRYNGVALDLPQAKRALERLFHLWGRPVNLKTVVKRVDDHDLKVAKRRNTEPEPEEVGLLVRYDGEEVTEEELPPEEVEDVAADAVDYDTKPEDWLA
jgi:stage V sporulation protein R